jgi:hypothetical protein
MEYLKYFARFEWNLDGMVFYYLLFRVEIIFLGLVQTQMKF